MGAAVGGRARETWIRLWALALGCFCALVSLHPIHESDPFWHLTLGRAVLEHGARVVPEPSAFPDFSDPAVAPEWLWDVTTYALHEAGGWPALAVFLAALAFLIGPAVVGLLSGARAGGAAPPAAAVGLVAVLVVALAASRVRLRPQTAFLVLLPTFLWLCQRYADAPRQARARLGAALVGLEVLWAQVHGSFVLGPAVFGLAVAPAWLRRPAARDAALHAAVGGALLLGWLSSAHGTGTFHYVVSHGAGDAALHVHDLHPPDWASFDPTAGPFALAYLALWALALAGMLVGRRADGAGLGLALLGVALLATANRFFAAAGILLSPLAVRGAAELAAAFPRPRGWLAAASACALLPLAWAGAVVDERYGPLGRVGEAEGVHPRAAAAFLGGAPEGARVLSAFSAGGPLGFWLDGRVRTYVDARTPLYFDASDFALARDLFVYADAMGRGLERFGALAVVVERERPGCTNLASGAVGDWVPAVVEPRFTTFVPRGLAPGLRTLEPCGGEFLGEQACREGGAALAADVAQLARLGESPFLGYLRAEGALRCAGDASAAAALLPDPGAARVYRDPRARLAGRILLARGDIAGALEALGPLARAGDLDALNLLGSAAAREPARSADLRRILESAAASGSDRTPPELRANLALVCMRDGDAECVRFHAIRAAARGVSRAREPLRWLAAQHPSARVRRDAARWLETLDGAPRSASADR